MDAIITFVNNFFTYIYNILKWTLEGFVIILTTVVQLLFEGFLVLVYAIVAGLDFGTLLTNTAVNWGVLNPNIGWFVIHLGISQGLSMLGYAYMIRLTLNLIPAAFTRI